MLSYFMYWIHKIIRDNQKEELLLKLSSPHPNVFYLCCIFGITDITIHVLLYCRLLHIQIILVINKLTLYNYSILMSRQ